MNTLNIDLGLQTYKLNDTCEVTFNPSDVEFINKIYDAFATMDEEQKTYNNELAKLDSERDYKQILALMRQKDTEMRKTIDSVFNAPVSDALFANMNTFALTNDGIPVWANLLMAIIDVCDTDSDTMHSKANAKVQQYINKYQKKYHK